MVLVCNDPPFVFLKTRKTASTSVEMLLEPFCVPEGSEIVERRGVTVCSRGIVGARRQKSRWRRHLPFVKDWYNHMPASHVRKNLGQDKWDASLKITTVRNPFARAVSQFHYRNQDLDFESMDAAQVRERFLAFLQGPWHDDTEIVTVDGRCVIDRFIRLEHMKADLDRLGQELGLPIATETIPHTKKLGSKRGGHSLAEIYGEEAKDIVRRRLKWVWDNIDYPTEP